MKKLIILSVNFLLIIGLYAQSPEKMSYQAVIRDANDDLIYNSLIGMQISILQGSETGIEVYIERHFPLTNANGLISLEIGEGTIISGDFSMIDWADGPYFIKSETDLNGGSNYTITGTSQLLSVPYALYANTADEVLTETDPLFSASPAFSISAGDITNWTNAYNWGDHSSVGYLTSFTEADPVFSASPANGILTSDITNWTTAYNWGDHSSAGYLTSFTETDPVFGSSIAAGITGTDTAYWNSKLDYQSVDWTLTGNAGTNPATNFIGTTDDEDFSIGTNNIICTRITTKGQIVPINTGQSILIGEFAGENNPSFNAYNQYIGYYAGANNSGGTDNVAIGRNSMQGTGDYFASNNIAIGANTLSSVSDAGDLNIAIGASSLNSLIGGVSNIAIGVGAASNNTYGYRNIAIGESSLRSNTYGNFNIAIGENSMYSGTTGNLHNLSFGYEAMKGTATYTDTEHNIALGHSALYSISGGDNNIALGQSSLYSNAIGTHNIAQGFNAMYYGTAGNDYNVALGCNAMQGTASYGNSDHNIAIGTSALSSVSGGSLNVAIGQNAARNATNAYSNIAIGSDALRYNSSGSGNISFGLQSLYYGTTGTHSNIAFGSYAMRGSALFTNTEYNIAIGEGALRTISGGDNNIAVGRNSLRNSTNGSYNIAQGYAAMNEGTSDNNYNLSFGYEAMKGTAAYTNTEHNVALGHSALYSISGGDNNIAVGHSSLYSNTNGFHNIAQGDNAMYYGTTGNIANVALGPNSMMGTAAYSDAVNNVAIGLSALYSISSSGTYNIALGNNTLGSLTIGTANIAIGYYALNQITTSIFNVAVGYNSGRNANSSTTSSTFLGSDANAVNNSTAYNYSVAIGQLSRINASRQVRIGNGTSNFATSIGGPVGWSVVSDGRFKVNLKENVPGLEFIVKLRPVTYNFDNEKLNDFINTPDSIRDIAGSFKDMQYLQTGFVAQEVEQAADELGFEFSGIDKPKNNDDYYSLRYSEFVVPLVKAIQEQQTIIEKQEETIIELQQRLSEIEKMLTE